MASRTTSAISSGSQTPEQLAAILEAFLRAHPHATVAEDGKLLFDLRSAKYSISTEHNRCTLQLWDDGRNIVRNIVSADSRNTATLRLRTQRLGHSRPQTLELTSPLEPRRTPSTRETTRTRYLAQLQRVLERHLPESRADGFRTAMDLEKSFGPAYARGSLLHGNQARAVIAVNESESTATIDGILSFGILWLAACRDAAGSRRHVTGLIIVVPRGHAATTLARLAWLAGPPSQWQLYELDQRTEELTLRDAADHGNLFTRLVQAPGNAAVQQRFAASSARVMALVPEAFRDRVAQRVRSGTELAFLLHGLEFARIRLRASAENFNRVEQITFGDAASETSLSAATEPHLRELVLALCQRRHRAAAKLDPLYRLQPERWLEDQLHRDISVLDSRLDPTHVYTQVSAIAGQGDRGLLDLLSVTADGRLAVIELKAAEDPQLALQGLDYWLRVRFHHRQNPDPATGLGEFQRHGYFGGIRLSALDPSLYLVAPALHLHPATEIILRHLSARVEWTLIALDERWRDQPRIVFRKRSDAAAADRYP